MQKQEQEQPQEQRYHPTMSLIDIPPVNKMEHHAKKKLYPLHTDVEQAKARSQASQEGDRGLPPEQDNKTVPEDHHRGTIRAMATAPLRGRSSRVTRPTAIRSEATTYDT